MARVDIGHGVTIDVVADDCGPVGIEYTHPNLTGGGRCAGFVYFDLPHVRDKFAPDAGQMWHLDQADPLTISPSLLCRGCSHRGFIREGAWVPA